MNYDVAFAVGLLVSFPLSQ